MEHSGPFPSGEELLREDVRAEKLLVESKFLALRQQRAREQAQDGWVPSPCLWQGVTFGGRRGHLLVLGTALSSSS